MLRIMCKRQHDNSYSKNLTGYKSTAQSKRERWSSTHYLWLFKMTELNRAFWYWVGFCLFLTHDVPWANSPATKHAPTRTYWCPSGTQKTPGRAGWLREPQRAAPSALAHSWAGPGAAPQQKAPQGQRYGHWAALELRRMSCSSSLSPSVCTSLVS